MKYCDAEDVSPHQYSGSDPSDLCSKVDSINYHYDYLPERFVSYSGQLEPTHLPGIHHSPDDSNLMTHIVISPQIGNTIHPNSLPVLVLDTNAGLYNNYRQYIPQTPYQIIRNSLVPWRQIESLSTHTPIFKVDPSVLPLGPVHFESQASDHRDPRIQPDLNLTAFDNLSLTWQQCLSRFPLPKVTNVQSRTAVILLDADYFVVNGLAVDVSDMKFELYLSEDEQDGRYKLFYRGDATEISLEDLKPYTTYYLRVSAHLKNIVGDLTDAVTFRTLPDVPRKPDPPKLVSRSKTSLHLRWMAPPDNGEKIRNFHLEYDKGNNDGNFVLIYSGLNHTIRVTKLRPATQFLFRLATSNAIGQSMYSDVVSFWTCSSAPSQPDPPMISQHSPNSVTVSWIRRSSDVEFILQMNDSSIEHDFWTVFQGQKLSCTVRNLRKNMSYKFRICSKNREGRSSWSDVVVYKTFADIPSIPGTPRLKGKINPTSFLVTWGESRMSDRSGVKRYILQMSNGEGYKCVYEGKETEFYCDNLQPGVTHHLRCAARSSSGQSNFSASCSLTTPPLPPGPCPAPIVAGQSTPISLDVCWDAPEYNGGAPVTEYSLTLTDSHSSIQEVYRGPDTSFTITNLQASQTYMVHVKASNIAGFGELSDPLVATTKALQLSAPTSLTITDLSPHSAKVAWNESGYDGSDKTEYRLFCTQSSGQEFHQLYCGSSTSFALCDLCPFTQYQVKVQAVNSAGSGPFSQVVAFTTPSHYPSQVTFLQATSTTTTVTILWVAPASPGSTITHYDVEYEDGTIVTVPGHKPEYTRSALSPSSSYRLRVRAVNDVGQGPFSVPLKIQTKNPVPPPPHIECTHLQPHCAKLRWGDGKDDPLIRYTLEMERSVNRFVPVYVGSSHAFKVSKLCELTAYRFRVSAHNDCGEKSVSDVLTLSTPRALPETLKAPSISKIGPLCCRVDWLACRHHGCDLVEYMLQIQNVTENGSYLTVYQGPAPTFTLTGLQPSNKYRVRVCAIRHCTDGLQLPGSFSPNSSFQTAESCSPPETIRVASNFTVKPSQISVRQTASLILLAFFIVSILLSVVAHRLLVAGGFMNPSQSSRS